MSRPDLAYRVKEMYRLIQLDDGSGDLALKAEIALATKGCTEFSHLTQNDIRNDQCWLQSIGYVLDSQ